MASFFSVCGFNVSFGGKDTLRTIAALLGAHTLVMGAPSSFSLFAGVEKATRYACATSLSMMIRPALPVWVIDKSASDERAPVVISHVTLEPARMVEGWQLTEVRAARRRSCTPRR